MQGSTFTASIRINPGGPVDTVDVSLGYDTAKLQYQSISYAGSPFDSQFGFSASAGTLHFTSVKLNPPGPVSTDSFIATVTFKALAGSGSSSLSLGGSEAAYGGTDTNPSLTGATVMFISSPTACPSGQTGTPPNCKTPVPSAPKPAPTPSPSPSPSPPAPLPVETAPKPSSATADMNPVLTETLAQYTLAKLKITTKASVQVYVRYGLDKKNLFSSTPVSSPGTNHEVSIDGMDPGTTVYYTVFSKNDKGQTVQTEIQSFALKGFDVKITAYDRDRKPLKNAEVTLHSTPQTAKTDDKGQVTFSNVTSGDHKLVYRNGKKTYSEQVVVVHDVKVEGEAQSAELQNFSVVYDLKQSSGSWLRPLLYTLLPAIVALAAYRLISGRRSRPQYAYDSTLVSRITVGGGASVPAASRDDNLTARLNSISAPAAITPGTVVKSPEESAIKLDEES
jgi:hypothetical protein